MRHPMILAFATTAVLGLAACGDRGEAEVDRALEDLNVIDESGLNDVMIQAADPAEAVDYFRRSIANDPGRVDLERGLAESLSSAMSFSLSH